MLCQAKMVVVNTQARACTSRGDFSAVLPQSYPGQSQLKWGKNGFQWNMRWICSEFVTCLNHQPGTAELCTLLIEHRNSYARNVEFFSIEAAWEGQPMDARWQHSLMLLHGIRKIPRGELKSDCLICSLFSSKHFKLFFIECLIFHYFQWIKRNVCSEKNDNA